MVGGADVRHDDADDLRGLLYQSSGGGVWLKIIFFEKSLD